MGYKETTKSEDEDNLNIAAELPLDDSELSFDQDNEDNEFSSEDDAEAALLDPDEILSNKKSKAQPETFSLQARRAIEDHLEQRRLRKELDYLFDDEFANMEEPNKK